MPRTYEEYRKIDDSPNEPVSSEAPALPFKRLLMVLSRVLAAQALSHPADKDPEYTMNRGVRDPYASFRKRDVVVVNDKELLNQLRRSQNVQRQDFQQGLKGIVGQLLTLTAGHETWKQLRSKVQESLSLGQVDSYVHVYLQEVESKLKGWRQRKNEGSPITVFEEVQSLLLEVAPSTLFAGFPVSKELKADLLWLKQYANSTEVPYRLLPASLQTALARVGVEALKRITRYDGELKKLVEQLFAESLSGAKTQEGVNVAAAFLQFYLEDPEVQVALEGAQSQFAGKSGSEILNLPVFQALIHQPTIQKALRLTIAEVQGSFSASVETTASTASWVLLKLAQDSDWYTKVVAEANALGDLSTVTYQSLVEKAPQTLAFISEVLRAHPPLGVQFREAVADVVVTHQGKKVQFPKGTLFFPNVQGIAAQTPFDPQRMLDEQAQMHGKNKAEKASANPSFAPGEAHFCPGRHLAQLEILLLILRVAQEFPAGFALVKGTNVETTYGVTNIPSSKAQITFV